MATKTKPRKIKQVKPVKSSKWICGVTIPGYSYIQCVSKIHHKPSKHHTWDFRCRQVQSEYYSVRVRRRDCEKEVKNIISDYKDYVPHLYKRMVKAGIV